MAEIGRSTAAGGFICSDKPAGVTSHDVVARYRRELGLKTGHAGTLDPFATGLLVILLGAATRLQRYVLGLPKTYVATARLGWTSSTGDPDGELTETGRVPAVDHLGLPTGTITQTVPMTSAVRVDGERLYKKARRGEEVERPAREVEIHRAELIGTGEGTATFEIECSAGTYIRTLIEELDDAYCESLRRIAIGDLRLPDGDDPESIRPIEEPGRPPAEHHPRSGGRTPRPKRRQDPRPRSASSGLEGPISLLFDGHVIAIARAIDGVLRTEVVLPSSAT